MFIGKRKENREETKRDGVSGFVVDLRARAEEEIRRDEKVLEEKIFNIKNRLKSVKPNFLGQKHISEKKPFVWPEMSIPKISMPSFKGDNKKKQYSYINRIITEQQRAFGSSSKLKKEKIKIKKVETKLTWYRSLFSFAIILILIIVPFKLLSYFSSDIKDLEERVMSRSKSALSSLMAATDSINRMDFRAADQQFQNAGSSFLMAQSELSGINDSVLSLASMSNNPKIKLAAESKKFLTIGTITSSLGHNLVSATDALFNGESGEFASALNSFSYFGNLAVADAKNLDKELKDININNLPEEYQEQFLALQEKARMLSNGLEEFIGLGDDLRELLGLSKDKRYLLVFQNNSEMRASGGFLGSYALVDLREGEIRNLEVPGGGSYDTKAGMSVLVKAPEPLWLVDPLWHFWDANWWPDWPTTAQNLMWFYERSDGSTVDGVIGLTPTVVEKLLRVSGPIDLQEEYGITIDADNFWETVQKITEDDSLAKFKPEVMLDYNRNSEEIESDIPLEQGLDENVENKPKKIIGDLMAKILETLPEKLNKESLVDILALFEESLSEKHVLFYFTDENMQREISQRNWAGEIKDTSKDYLMVVNTNIAGQKTDRKIDQKIEHFSEVNVDGDIINTVKISRTHRGVKREAFTGVRNVNWLRVYVPEGSELIAASGFRFPDQEYFEEPDSDWEDSSLLVGESKYRVHEASQTRVYQENGKTVFANWTMLDPGETREIIFQYRIPVNFFTKAEESNWWKRVNSILNPDTSFDFYPYSLLIQKQAGDVNTELFSQLKMPGDSEVFWRYPDTLKGKHGWQMQTDLNSDKYWSILVNKDNK